MAQNWRLARSLEVLRDEIRSVHPGTTVWTIGDVRHRSTWSDHNPTSSGVVCAIDVLGDKGLNLGKLAELTRTRNHPAWKYTIFNRRIISKARLSEGWRPYYGSNPHKTHVHISVGVGPDGRSTGPYDDTSPWGVANTGGGYVPSTRRVAEPTLRDGDSGPGVELLQSNLNVALDLDLVEDGRFGPNTTGGVKLLQDRAGITEDGIYGPDSAGALADLLEDDMEPNDKIPFPQWAQDRYNHGPEIFVRTTLASGYAHSREAKDRVKQLQSTLASHGALLEKLIAAQSGLTTDEIRAAVAAGVREGIPDAAQIAADVVAAVVEDLEDEIDASTLESVFESALRRVFGALDEAS